MMNASLSTVGYGVAWVREFLERGSGLVFDDEATVQVSALAERKLLDLFDVAEDAALANGRTIIMRHDLPITKGLRAQMGEAARLAQEIDRAALNVYLAEAGAPGQLDERVRDEVPLMMATLLVVAARVIAVLEPASMSTEERLDRLLRVRPTVPTPWEIERARRVVEMTL
jgi:hypothetical protein